MHIKLSPQLGHSPIGRDKCFQFNVKNGCISKTSCSKWGPYNSSLLFMHSMHSSVFYFIIIIIMKVMSQIIPSTTRTCQGDLWGGGGALFVLTHFRALHSIANHIPFCLFPSIVDDIHIIGLPLIISSTYEHFQTKLHVMGLSIQPQKCVAWSLSSLPPDFNTPSWFTTPFEGIRVLGVPLGTFIFTSSFIKNVLQKDARQWTFSLKWAMFKWPLKFQLIVSCNAHCIFYNGHLLPNNFWWCQTHIDIHHHPNNLFKELGPCCFNYNC